MDEKLLGDIMNLKSVQVEGEKTLEEISKVKTGIVNFITALKPKKKERQEENE